MQPSWYLKMSFTPKEITEIVGFIFASGVVSILLTWFINKKRTKVEIKKLTQETESGQVQSAALILSMAQNLMKDISAERTALAEENERLEVSVKHLNNRLVEFETQV